MSPFVDGGARGVLDAAAVHIFVNGQVTDGDFWRRRKQIVKSLVGTFGG